MNTESAVSSHASRTATYNLLVIDDDPVFCQVLARALRRRGWTVHTAGEPVTALQQAQVLHPTHSVLDLNLAGESGLELIPKLLRIKPTIQIVVLTGYASIATTVEAIKRGAVNYLAKPADADQINAAFHRNQNQVTEGLPLPFQPLSLDRLEWEHIQQVLHANGGNISATARCLGMHRRTLQRKLAKRPVKS